MSRRFFNRDVNSQADFHAASPSQWQLACQREAVIRPLAETDRLSCLQVDRAAKILGLGRSVTYLPAHRPLQATAAGFRSVVVSTRTIDFLLFWVANSMHLRGEQFRWYWRKCVRAGAPEPA